MKFERALKFTLKWEGGYVDHGADRGGLFLLMGFGANAISVVTGGLKRSTGSFSERMVTHGLIGDIAVVAVTRIRRMFGKWFRNA